MREARSSSASLARIATGPTEPSAQRTDLAVPVDDEGHVGDGDDHGVARADLQELLRAESGREPDLDDDLARRERGALGADDELVERDACAGPACWRRTIVASSAASTGSVSPAGEAVPRLPPSVPALRICGEPTVRDACARPGRRSLERRAHQLGVGDAGAEDDLGAFDPPPLQLGNVPQADHRRRPAVGETDLHHEVGPARPAAGRRGIARMPRRPPRATPRGAPTRSDRHGHVSEHAVESRGRGGIEAFYDGACDSVR